jgi:TraM recognition site of TraD and TraG
VSEGAGQGLLTLACLQDLSQARRRWGPEADAFVSLFGTTVVLGGIADRRTLELLSVLGGDIETPTRTVSRAQGADRRIRSTSAVGTVLRRRLPVEVLAQGHPGMALAFDERNRPAWVVLTPAHQCSPWRELTTPNRTVERQRDGLALGARYERSRE